MDKRELVETGVPGFDVLLGGGIPCRQALAIVGNPGSGKTVLASQIAFTQARKGHCVVMGTLTSEPHLKLIDDLRGFAYFDEGKIGSHIFLHSAYSALKKGPKELKDMLLGSVREHKASVLCLDGLRAIRELWRDEAKLREFLYELGVGLASSNCIAVYTSEYPIEKLMDLPEATTVDGIVSLSVRPFGAQRLRRAEIVKLRGRNHLRGEHSMRIDDSGINMIPRLENLDLGEERKTKFDEDIRPAFGLAELDKLLHGGLPRASTTTILGATGVGKTLLALNFCAAGAKAGERTMFFSFNEHADHLIRRARLIGLDIENLVRTGKLVLRHELPIELDVDDWAATLLKELRDLKADRLVVDSLGDLLHAVVDQNRSNNFLVALVEQLRTLGITTVFTKEIPKVAVAELDFSEAPMPVAGENLLLLRHVELAGKIHRVMSTLKMRSSPHDWHVREFVIDGGGFRVLEPVESVDGLLLGSARHYDREISINENRRRKAKDGDDGGAKEGR
jgi:circadian clock protein KaiC